jgi:hypothetical protein
MRDAPPDALLPADPITFLRPINTSSFPPTPSLLLFVLITDHFGYTSLPDWPALDRLRTKAILYPQ